MNLINHRTFARTFALTLALAPAAFIIAPAHAQTRMASSELEPLRPPSVPLVTHDPYFSAWSVSDALTETDVRHWTGTNYGLCGLVRIDGQTFRCLGTHPPDVPAMAQTGLEVTATRTTYTFGSGGISLALTFLSPLLPHDLDVLARPVTYITWEARATDGRASSRAR